MKIESLAYERIQEFVDYCKSFRRDIDDSFLYDEDLNGFKPNEENPTYVVTDSEDRIVGAASLIIDDYNKRGKKGRFRILHAINEDIKCYELLLGAILKHTDGLNKIFLFIPMVNENQIRAIEGINFKVERYSFLFLREKDEVAELSLSEGYEIKTFRPGMDEEAWCLIRNEGFKNLQGSETPMTPEMVKKMVASEDYIDGGLMMLYHGEQPIGVVRGAEDKYEETKVMNIGPLAILPDYQGKGLGRNLLRASLHFAKEHDYNRMTLCVNAENERAKALYLQEGFKQIEAAVCYKYELE